MKKLALFLSGMLLGIFLTGFIMLHERDRRTELGPQPADCGDSMSKVEYGSH